MSKAEQVEQVVEAVFQNDKDGNGLTKDEIAKILNESEDSKSVQGFMDSCDKDGDGKVSKDEFREIMMKSVEWSLKVLYLKFSHINETKTLSESEMLVGGWCRVHQQQERESNQTTKHPGVEFLMEVHLRAVFAVLSRSKYIFHIQIYLIYFLL